MSEQANTIAAAEVSSEYLSDIRLRVRSSVDKLDGEIKDLILAARAGQASADMALAQLWSQGRGIQPNRVNAYVFGQLAVQQQVPQASDLLGQIEAQLPPAERSQAQQLLKREQQSRGNNWQATVSLLQSQDSPINEEEPESL